MNNPYAVYAQSIKLFLQTSGPTTAGRLQYHITGRQEDIEKCLAQMQEKGEIEQAGIEQNSPAYQGQTLYQLRIPFAAEQAGIERRLDEVNEELLGLHRYGVMSYQEYADTAGLLLDVRARLKELLQGYRQSKE